MISAFQIRLLKKRSIRIRKSAAVLNGIAALFTSTRNYINSENFPIYSIIATSAPDFRQVRFFNVKYERYLSLTGCRSPPPMDFANQKIQNPEGKNVTDHIDWDELLKKEDKLIENSDRKHRYHFKSLDNMSEELVYQESVMKYQEYEPEATESENFIESVKDERLASALRQLTAKQRKAMELAYWKGYKQWEIAALMGCKRNTVTELLARAMERLSRYMTD